MVLAMSGLISVVLGGGGDPTACCCYEYMEYTCCTQAHWLWSIPCGGATCVGPHTNSGRYDGKTFADCLEFGYPYATTLVAPNGSFCRYREPMCIEGMCSFADEWTVWDCHDEELSGACEGQCP